MDLSSVPFLVKNNYFGRIIYALLMIPPTFSIFYQRGLAYHFYLFFFMHFALYPHLAFFLAHLTKNPKKFELTFIMNAEHFFAGLWLPIMLFNPLMMFLGFISSTSVAMLGGGGISLVCTKTISWICGGIAGGIFWGFNFSSEISSSTMLWTGITIFGGIFFTNLIWVRTNKIIISTRKDLKEQKTKLDEELTEAADYVKTMLPSPISEGPVYIEWLFVPSASLGGDAFGYNWLDDNHFAIYLLDVSGHGVGAAFLSVSVLNVLRPESLTDIDFKIPNQVLGKLNMTFQGEKHNDMFFTLWYGVYNVPTRTLTYASAGHPPALLLSKGSNITHLKTRNFVIGGMLNVEYEQKIQSVDAGTSLYVFSDGVYEIKTRDGSMWGFREYTSLLSDLDSNKYNSLDNLYNETLQLSKGEAFEDDYTILRARFI
ncbi:MAG: SpoIIE family protein phosphatase [Desulfobacterales bacterium]|nr:MAG: SpoIIE family protein phosphatase [Desulfobacterales bacterium]